MARVCRSAVEPYSNQIKYLYFSNCCGKEISINHLHISLIIVVALASDTFPEQTHSLQKSSHVTAA